MNEDKKNIPLNHEILDEELDRVSGGARPHARGGNDERPKQLNPVFAFQCTFCGVWNEQGELAANGGNCSYCKKQIDTTACPTRINGYC